MAELVANGTRLHVQRLGTGGTPVVFLHGLVMDNLSSWYFTVATAAAQEREALLYDLRGHGRSERPPSGYRLADHVEDLRALLDAAGIAGPVHLVGNSFGGLLALAFARAHPDRAASLCLVDGHLGDDGFGRRMTETLSLEGEARDRKIAESFAAWLGRHSERKRTRLADAAHALVHRTSLVADLAATPTLTATELAEIRCPVLALYGEHSDLRAAAERLVPSIPHARLELVPGCTHSILWEATDHVRAKILAWLAHPPPAGAWSLEPGASPQGASPPGASPPRARRPARVLFVVPPLTGHVNPTVAVARELEARGHQVAWVGHPGAVRPLLPEGATLHALDDRLPEGWFAPVLERSRKVRGLASLQFLWEELLVPLARAMRPAVEEVIRRERPDVVVVDQQAVGGALAARRAGVPWATSCTTSAGVTDPLAGLPQVKAWVDGQLAALVAEAGLPETPAPDLSPHQVLVFSTEALVGPTARFPPTHRFVGPSIARRPETVPFPFEALRDVPRVLVSLGTVNAERGAGFWSVVAEALAGLPLQVIAVAPDGALAPPDNFLVRPRVPQLALLPHVQAVVCHGGHNTVCEALAHGLPLLVTPIRDDQPVVAQQVVDAGAGLRLRFGRLTAGEVRAAVERLLADVTLREGAARVQASFARAGGAAAAADALLELTR